MIKLNGRYRMTAASEKAMIKLGGADPEKNLEEQEVSRALVKSINLLVENNKYHILEKIFRSAAKNGDSPGIPSP